VYTHLYLDEIILFSLFIHFLPCHQAHLLKMKVALGFVLPTMTELVKLLTSIKANLAVKVRMT
jgi:hypothetical protein